MGRLVIVFLWIGSYLAGTFEPLSTSDELHAPRLYVLTLMEPVSDRTICLQEMRHAANRPTASGAIGQSEPCRAFFIAGFALGIVQAAAPLARDMCRGVGKGNRRCVYPDNIL